MRARLLAVGLLALLAGAFVLPAPAYAADISRVGLPAGISTFNEACPLGGTAGSTTATHVQGPTLGGADPASGAGSLRVEVAQGSQGGLTLSGSSLATLTHLTLLGEGAGPMYVQIRYAGTSGTKTGTSFTMFSAGTWGHTPVELVGSSMSWNGAYQATLAEELLNAPNGGAGVPFTVRIMTYEGCQFATTGAFYLDTLRFAADGADATWDFEPADLGTPSLSISPSATITAGSSTAIGGTVGPAALAGESVTLMARASGQPSFTAVGTSVVAADGSVALSVQPTATTTYHWTFAGHTYFAPADSADATVGVRTKVTIKVADPTLHKGDKLVVTGKVSPTKAGSAIKLRRVGQAAALATGQVKSDGSYRISVTASTKGSWQVFTTIAAQSGNLAGTSVKKTVTIS